MFKKVFYTLIALCPLLFVACNQKANTENDKENTANGSLELVPSKEFISQYEQKKAQGAQLIDIRTPEEVAQGYIENALNWDFNAGEFDQKIAELDPKKPVFVYCAAGGRSAKAAKTLKDKGFEVIELEGGFGAWKQDQMPVKQ